MQTTRGRPPEAEPEKIIQAALRLFERKGFDAVTMEQIATASGVSRRTLFRLFPAKADLLWHGLSDFRTAIDAAAAPFLGKGLPVSGIVDNILVPVLEALRPPAAAKLARRKLRLIASAPALLNHQLVSEIEAIIAQTIAPRSLTRGVPVELAARSLVAAAFGALIWWAEHGEHLTATDAVLGALEAVGRTSKR